MGSEGQIALGIDELIARVTECRQTELVRYPLAKVAGPVRLLRTINSWGWILIFRCEQVRVER